MNLDLEALETSFDIVAPHGDELVDVFYVRLFEAARPSVRCSPTPTSAAGTIARRSHSDLRSNTSAASSIAFSGWGHFCGVGDLARDPVLGRVPLRRAARPVPGP